MTCFKLNVSLLHPFPKTGLMSIYGHCPVRHPVLSKFDCHWVEVLLKIPRLFATLSILRNATNRLAG